MDNSADRCSSEKINCNEFVRRRQDVEECDHYERKNIFQIIVVCSPDSLDIRVVELYFQIFEICDIFGVDK